MWIEQRKDGKYVYREKYLAPSGRWKTVSVTYTNRTRATVKRASDHLEEVIRQKSAPPAQTVTIQQMVDDYIKARKPEVKPITFAVYERARKRLLGYFEPEHLVATISAREWQTYFDGIGRDHTPGVAKTLYQFVKAAMEQAERLDGLSAVPIHRVRVQMPYKTVATVKAAAEKFLTRDELQEVLGLIRDQYPYIAEICEFQALTGLRYGELAALRDVDYDPVNHIIDVNATLNFNLKGNRTFRGSPKNIYSIRKVALSDRAVEIIEQFIRANDAARPLSPFPGYKLPDHFIFVSRRDGYPLDISYVNHILRRIQYKKKLTTHIFRHTHISILAEQGVPLKAIMQRVGHNEPRTTIAVYTHVTDQMEKETVDKLNALDI